MGKTEERQLVFLVKWIRTAFFSGTVLLLKVVPLFKLTQQSCSGFLDDVLFTLSQVIVPTPLKARQLFFSPPSQLDVLD